MAKENTDIVIILAQTLIEYQKAKGNANIAISLASLAENQLNKNQTKQYNNK